jgi:hypothetical protein
VIPECADILVAFSCFEGHASFRHTQDGSFFIQNLVDVFRRYASHEDVLSMLTIVNKRVSEKGQLGAKQVPQSQFTLTKKLFFWPGIDFD